MAAKGLVLVIALVALGLVSSASASGPNQPHSLKYVGSADHKSFFADDEKRLGAHAAGLFCEEFNLKLASIDTKAQVEMLQSALSEEGFRKAYHTTGREIISLVNGETGEPLDTSIFGRVSRIPNEIPAACAHFVVEGERSNQLQFWDCAYSAIPLCST